MNSFLDYWQVDAFTNQSFKGNPAAVVLLKDDISDELKQNIAMEMNLSETAFVHLRENKNPLIRWFTPICEVDLCGHATLASAHIYFSEIYPDLEQVTFDTKYAGVLNVRRAEEGYIMNFPSRPGIKNDMKDVPDFVLNALSSAIPLDVRKARDLMLVYEDEQIIYDMAPDHNVLMEYEGCVVVTAKSNHPDYDFVSRYFAPNEGIDEDPVTGSAHCTLAPYWAERFGKSNLVAYQASKRGGQLVLEVKEDSVFIEGGAVTIFRGQVV